MDAITVYTRINASLEEVWRLFTTAEDIEQWNTASEDWHTTAASNDLQVGGKFNYRMEAKDGSFGFDFWGIYNTIEDFKKLEYTLGDGRKVRVGFEFTGTETIVTETFETEDENPVEMQQFGWQAILDNFKKHVENQQ
ncbi:MAG: SRPBCC domain-containing protein [Paludibacter sp.]